RSQRVLDRIGNGRRRRDGAALAQAFDAQRVARRWELEMYRLDQREIVRLGHRVVHQRARQELARLVINHLLEEGAADTLRDAAVHLPLDDDRIDDATAIVGDDIPE